MTDIPREAVPSNCSKSEETLSVTSRPLSNDINIVLNVSQGTLQASCLDFVFWCVQHSVHISRQFHAMNGTELVMRLLYSPKMDTRSHVLKVIAKWIFIIIVIIFGFLGSHACTLFNSVTPLQALLDNCFSESLFLLDDESSRAIEHSEGLVRCNFVCPSSELIITDLQLFSSILYHWPRAEFAKMQTRKELNLDTEPDRLVCVALFCYYYVS